MFNYANSCLAGSEVEEIVAPIQLQKSALPFSDDLRELLWVRIPVGLVHPNSLLFQRPATRLSALEMILSSLGYEVAYGSSLAAAQRALAVFNDSGSSAW
jgi:hypothetical protein